MAAPCSDNKQNYHHQVHHHQGQGTLLEFRLEVPFPSAAEATVALRSLQPDREPRSGRGVSKELAVSGSVLSGQWSADEARTLRVSVSSFLDHLTLVLETMEAFGPPFVHAPL